MATKKSKRSQAKKSVKPEKATTTEASEKKAEDTKVVAAKVKSDEAKDKATEAKDEEPAEEVVEVVEIEEPVTEITGKASISDKLLALNRSAIIAEIIGTALLSIAFISLFSNTSYGAIAISLSLAALALIFGGISGAHLNPAVTIAQWITRKINGVKAIAYIVAQVLGAIIGFFVLTGINNITYDYKQAVYDKVTTMGVTADTIDDAGGIEKWAKNSSGMGSLDSVAQYIGVSKTAPKLSQYNTLASGKEWAVAIAELAGTFVFGLGAAYFTKNYRRNRFAASFAFGFALFIGLLMAGKTGILNPALSAVLGVYGSKVSTVLWALLVYVVAPVVGMTIAYVVYGALTKDELANEEAIAE